MARGSGVTPERLAVLERQLAETEAYAKEGWDWLGEALEALGAKTVFDIKARKRRLAQADEALRKIASWEVQSHQAAQEVAREALRAEPAKEPRG